MSRAKDCAGGIMTAPQAKALIGALATGGKAYYSDYNVLMALWRRRWIDSSNRITKRGRLALATHLELSAASVLASPPGAAASRPRGA